MADLEHACDRRGGVQVDAFTDLVAEHAGVIHKPRCTGLVLGTTGIGEALGDPHPQMYRAAPAIRPGFQSAQQDPRTQRRDGHAAQRRDEQQEAGGDPPPVDRHQPWHRM